MYRGRGAIMEKPSALINTISEYLCAYFNGSAGRVGTSKLYPDAIISYEEEAPYIGVAIEIQPATNWSFHDWGCSEKNKQEFLRDMNLTFVSIWQRSFSTDPFRKKNVTKSPFLLCKNPSLKITLFPKLTAKKKTRGGMSPLASSTLF